MNNRSVVLVYILAGDAQREDFVCAPLFLERYPILVNEGGFQCYEDPQRPKDSCNNPDRTTLSNQLYLDDQADYVIRYYVRGIGNKLVGIAYYTLNGPNFRQGGLSDGTVFRKGYTALKFLAGKLTGTTLLPGCNGQLSQGMLEGYKFSNGSKEYRVYWTNFSDSTIGVPRPTGTITVYNKFGAIITPGGTSAPIRVGFDPIVIESNPQPASRCKTHLPVILKETADAQGGARGTLQPTPEPDADSASSTGYPAPPVPTSPPYPGP